MGETLMKTICRRRLSVLGCWFFVIIIWASRPAASAAVYSYDIYGVDVSPAPGQVTNSTVPLFVSGAGSVEINPSGSNPLGIGTGSLIAAASYGSVRGATQATL